MLTSFQYRVVYLMTIDTEGSEYAIVSSFPWKAIRVDVVLVETLDENTYPSHHGNQYRIIRHMNNSGYALYKSYVVAPNDTYDLVFVHNAHPLRHQRVPHGPHKRHAAGYKALPRRRFVQNIRSDRQH